MPYRPGDTVFLGEIRITAYREQTFGPNNGGGYDDFSGSREARKIGSATRNYILGKFPPLVAAAVRNQETLYSTRLGALATSIDDSLSAIREKMVTTALTAIEALNQERSIRETLLAEKSAAITTQIATANSYYRSNFFSRRVSDFMRIAISDSMIFANPDKNFQNWQNSLHAAYAAKLLNDEITYLTQQIAWLTAQVEQAKAAEAAEQAQLLAEAQTLRAANTFRVSALPVGAQLSTTAGSIALTAGSSLTLDTAIQAAIQALRGLAATVLDRATGVGIGLLLYSPALGNSDLYPTAMSIPAAGLAPQLPGNLPEIAAAGGTVDMPYRIYGDRTHYSLIATPVGDRAAAKVPVRALTLDPSLNAYTFTSADTPPRTLVFPIAAPGNSSTTSPAQPMDVPVYSGVTLTPITATTEVLPAVDPLDIRDAIYVFPAGSGIAPVYLVFSESLDAGRFTRKQLDKKYLKHASDFGIDDTRKNSATLTKFRDAINRHLEDQETVPKGTYLLAEGSSVYFNPKTNNVVILDKNGNFLSGWKIEPGTQQFINYVEKGNLR
ncbi:S-type pyocin domain-containing protein [Pseudomonas sp. LF090]